MPSFVIRRFTSSSFGLTPDSLHVVVVIASSCNWVVLGHARSNCESIMSVCIRQRHSSSPASRLWRMGAVSTCRSPFQCRVTIVVENCSVHVELTQTWIIHVAIIGDNSFGQSRTIESTFSLPLSLIHTHDLCGTPGVTAHTQFPKKNEQTTSQPECNPTVGSNLHRSPSNLLLPLRLLFRRAEHSHQQLFHLPPQPRPRMSPSSHDCADNGA